jgi:phosphoribosyl 1,2-cyclic phosphodiesterase
VEYAVHVAAEAGVRRLALFHHDPSHDDVFIDCLVERARLMAGARIDEVLAASEGLTIVL